MKKYLFFFALCSFCFLLKADPLLIKGADGEYLPVLAEGWIEKDGGVLLNVNDKVDLALLKEALIKRFPGMGIEVIGRNVFFSAVTKQTLFPILAGFDTGISSRRDPFAALYDAKKDEILLESTRKTARSDGKGLIEATVNILEMDGIAGYATVEILINKNRSTGTYRRLRGRRRLKVYFIKKGDVIDPSAKENLEKSDVLLLDKGSVIFFSIRKKESDGSYVPGSIYVKKF